MIPISHAATGIFILRIFSFFNPAVLFNLPGILIAILLSLLPDIDIFWAKKLNTHKSFLHAPLPWILLFVILYSINFFTHFVSTWILYFLIVQALAHILLDYITCRTAGVKIFYPFQNKEYSLFPHTKSYGNLELHEIVGKKSKNFWKHYLKNKNLVFFELLTWLLGVAVFL